MLDPEPDTSATHSVGEGGRPTVDVITPFAGSPAELDLVLRRLGSISTLPGDTCTVAHNRERGVTLSEREHARIVAAGEVHSSYYARNRGAEAGSAEWLLFLDGDVIPPAGIVDAYFDPPPARDVGVLAGAIRDEPAEADASFAVRYSSRRRTLSQDNTLTGEWAYAQTANCAVRRTAFEAVGGFREDLRSGGDADLCFRLREAGWRLEARPAAEVVHLNRTTMRALFRQRMRHGSGAGWLDRAHPGSAPGHGSWLGLAKWTLQSMPAAALSFARGDREAARVRLADAGVLWALEIGRLLPNEVRPQRARRGRGGM